jgi:hypothetical protein
VFQLIYTINTTIVTITITISTVVQDETMLCILSPPLYIAASGPPPPIVQDYNHGSAVVPPIQLPDLSRPPPGFPAPGFPPPAPQQPLPPPQLSDLDLMPTVPYYELPAGLMAPLVNVSTHSAGQSGTGTALHSSLVQNNAMVVML